MNKQKFVVADWLPTENVRIPLTVLEKNYEMNTQNDPEPVSMADLELVTSRIEAAKIDLTASRGNWIKLGIAFANSLGENGRSYFQRICVFYPGYSSSECDSQYNKCLKTENKRTNISTFFFLAKQVGIDINPQRKVGKLGCRPSLPEDPTGTSAEDETEPIDDKTNTDSGKQESTNTDHTSLIFDTPQLPDEIYAQLPTILRESCTLFRDGIERDIFLISALGVLSACLPNIQGYYFNKPLSPHLYIFITGPSAGGKGGMEWAKRLAQSIHDYLTEQSLQERNAYAVELERYETLTKPQKQGVERPIEPKRLMFFIPANSSTSALIQAIAENNSHGLIFETEADTMANTAKQEWGNSNENFRKAYHHESISLFRRKEKEYLEIKDPHLAIVISGTPKQVQNIMPETESGLFSRFLYYAFEDRGGFNSPFESHTQENYPEYFKQKGIEVFELYKELQKLTKPIIFKLTKEQEQRFTKSFNHMLNKDRLLIGSDFDANVKRLGIIHFRIAAILTALRILEDGELPNPMICNDKDYQTAETIVTTLEKHALAVFQKMPNNGLKGIKLTFYESLPQKFDRQMYLKVADELGIQIKAADKYIKLFQPKLLKHDYNEYTKIIV